SDADWPRQSRQQNHQTFAQRRRLNHRRRLGEQVCLVRRHQTGGVKIKLPPLPEQIETEGQLDEWMTRPRPALVAFTKTLSSPLLILGVGGKMGPTLAVLARRAAE